MGKNTIFVSYRRTDLNGKTSGTDIARTIKQHLEISGYKNRVFFDYSELSDDEFENIILSEIRGCEVFILVLTHDTMHRCVNDDDWVRREILEAAKHNIKIIPIEVDNLFNGYPEGMISDLDIVKRLQHSKVHMDSSFENDMNAIIEARIAPVTKPRKSNKLKHILIASFAIIALVVAGWLIIDNKQEAPPVPTYPTHEPAVDELLEIDGYLKAISNDCPVDTGYGVIMMEVYRYDDTIIYEYNVSNIDTRGLSEEEFNDCVKFCTAEMKPMKPMFAQQWAESYLLGLENEIFSDAVQIIECGMNIAYHFRDSNGIRLFTMKINNSEIWDAIEKNKPIK